MVVWGLVLSAATIVISFWTKSSNNEEGTTTSRTSRTAAVVPGSGRNLVLTTFLGTRENVLFVSGVVFGLGLSLLYSTCVEQFRLPERARLLWNTWLWSSSDDNPTLPYRLPVDIRSVLTSGHDFEKVSLSTRRDDETSTSSGTNSSSSSPIEWIVSPKTAATSTLTVSILTLEPGMEMPSRKSAGVEFYYVLSGHGQYSQQGIVETLAITEGDAFVVDCGHIRWISNSSTSAIRDDEKRTLTAGFMTAVTTSIREDSLILLRATDGGSRYSSPLNFDGIRRDPNRSKRITTLQRLSDGIRQVNAFGREYLTGRGGAVN